MNYLFLMLSFTHMLYLDRCEVLSSESSKMVFFLVHQGLLSQKIKKTLVHLYDVWVDGSIDQQMMVSSKGILLYVYDVSSDITDVVQT